MATPIEINGTLYASAEALLKAARARFEAGPPLYRPHEQRLLIAAWPHLEGQKPATYQDVEFARVARNLWATNVSQHAPPNPPTPYDDEIAELEQGALRAKANLEAAQERKHAAERIVGRAGASEWFHDGMGWTMRPVRGRVSARELEQATDAATEAKAEAAVLEVAWRMANDRQHRLTKRREYWRQEQDRLEHERAAKN